MWLIFPLVALALVAVLLGVALAAVVAVAIKLGPIILILIGAWLLLRAIRGPRHDWREQPGAQHRHRRWSEPAPQPVAPRRPPQPQRPTQPEARPTAPPRRELPIDVQVKVDQIQRKADVLLG